MFVRIVLITDFGFTGVSSAIYKVWVLLVAVEDEGQYGVPSKTILSHVRMCFPYTLYELYLFWPAEPKTALIGLVTSNSMLF